MSRYEDPLPFANEQLLEEDYEDGYQDCGENDDFFARVQDTMSYQDACLPPSAYPHPSHVSAGYSIPLTESTYPTLAIETDGSIQESHGSSYQTSRKTGTTSETSAKPESGHFFAAMNPSEPMTHIPVLSSDFLYMGGANTEIDYHQNMAGMNTRDPVQVDVEAALQQNGIPPKYETLAPQLGQRELMGIAQVQPNSQAIIEEEIRHVCNMILESEPNVALECLAEFKEIINKKKCEKLKASKTTSSKPSRAPPPDTSKKDKSIQCIAVGCNILFGHVGSLQRHVESSHHPRATICCPEPGCQERCHRTDKFRDHCRLSHLRNPSNEEIKHYTIELPAPASCSLCTRTVKGWKEFYRCFKSHCLSVNGRGEAGAPNDDGSNRDIFDQGPYNAQLQNNGSNFSGPRNDGLGMHEAQEYNNLGNNYYPGNSTQNWQHLQAQSCISPTVPRQASDMLRSSSDGIIARQPPQARLDVPSHAHHQKRQASEQDHSELPGGSNELGSTTQRPFKRSRQTRNEPQEYQHCRTCSHLFKDCTICKSKVVRPGARCHACPTQDAVRLQESALISQRSRHNELNPSQAGMNMNYLNMIDLGNLQQFPSSQNFPTQRSFGRGNVPSSRRPGNYGPSTGNPQGRSNFTNMVMFMDVSELSEEEMLSPKSKTPDACFGTWLSCLPIRDSLPRWLSKVPQTAKALECETEEAVTSESQLSIILPTAKLANISPFVCGCPCVTKSLLSSNARVEIVPGRHLDMNVTILSEDRTSHPLRTRVHVVIKLLKLRSSVARSANKKKNQEDARTIQQVLMASLAGSASANLVEEAEEDTVDDTDVSESEDDDGLFSDVESVTSSVDDTSSVADLGNALVPYKRPGYGDLFSGDDSDEESEDDEDVLDLIAYRSSGPDDHSGDAVFDETQALYIGSDGHEVEEVGEVELEMSFDLDLQDCLDTLASLTDGLADVQSSDDTTTDPELVFNYFFRYIVYLIFSLSRSRVTARRE
ncbi:hypothetical protein N7466_005961 [Penicillium verhagenii]|uniref:uncharacterized protein n=1 Tax=Penicillium verhagenii TaxID=1562060 RepID=UPI002545482E|nr:uncharacterized protein N7466_005961 [Penicillium verhagenii]KAJ5930468.1 hypothetical protein N7466_005961 [Penicillium verhagenii]